MADNPQRYPYETRIALIDDVGKWLHDTCKNKCLARQLFTLKEKEYLHHIGMLACELTVCSSGT